MQLRTGLVVLALLGLSAARVCPDGGMCEDKDTCCRDTEGGYGCCPLPHAECCSDHLHCCYEGTLCDLVHEKCVNKTVSLSWRTRLPAKPPVGVLQLRDRVKTIVCPDQVSTCTDDSTCCQLPDSSWGCCPLVKAVCCDDKVHCCPEGTTCDTAHEMCLSASLESVPMLQKLPSVRRDNHSASAAQSVGSVTCPGGTSSCPESYTCCLLPGGDYGCCPYPQATCCSDHVHCCPGNTTCDLEHGVCRSGDARLPLLETVSAAPADIVCPDKASVCPDGTTCCQMDDGSYGCCPMPNAACCSDHVHCCPEGTQCDLQRSTCQPGRGGGGGGAPIRASEISAAVAAASRAVPCNDSVACADGNTCCQTPLGQWACCPLPKAVCCEDHMHCCPHGTVCNLAASTCDDPASNTAVTPWLDHLPVSPIGTEDTKCDQSTSCPGTSTSCPGTSTSCPGTSTCCRTLIGGWACCPLPQAVCCDDHVHCCPHGTVCNLEAESCDDPSGSSPSLRWTEKVPAGTSEVRGEKCDGETVCPGGTTCCEGHSGHWACCPLPQAVCCSDQRHCCPKGSTCDEAERRCETPSGRSLPWLQKIPALKAEARKACDAVTSCPRDTTCCFMDRTHRWGCCPLPKAVCCGDGTHCCPDGHTCDPRRSACSRGSRSVPWLSKLSARTEPAAVTDVKCDDTSSCATGTTCCKLETGGWGCCPLVKAVCCEDHEHCCPQSYTCNMQTGTCEKKDDHEPLQTVPLSKVVRPGAGDAEDVPCDGTGEFRCPREDTCCKTSPSEWGCCPSPRATCCPDSAHCCPEGLSCAAGGCTAEDTQLTWDILFRDRQRDVVPQGL